MAEQILPVTGLDQVGVILDTPPVALPPNGFSDARNVRFRDGAVSKMEGEVNAYPNLFDPETQIIKYTAWWPNPNLADNQSGYYLVIVEDTADEMDVAYLVKPDTTSLANVNRKGSFTRDTQANWQHTFFQGGFAIIINNGLDAPHYILDQDGNDSEGNVPQFAPLPGWDSYNFNDIAINDTFQTGDTEVFSLDQAYDSDVYNFTVSKNDTELTNMFVDESEVLPSFNANTVLLVYGRLGVHTIHFTGLLNNDTINVEIESKNPVDVRAAVVRAFGDVLVAGNLYEVDSTNNSIIIRNLPGVVRTSDVAAPGDIPNNWNPFAAGVSTADEFVISDTGITQDMVALQGNLYIYSNQSISVMRSTGNASIPFTISNVTDSYGAQTTDVVVEYDGKHFVIGSQDIYIFGGHPGSIQSIADARVRRYLFDNLNPLHEQRMFVLRYQQRDEIWVCFPTTNSVIGECDQALIWNYRNNTWTIRDLRNVVAGDVGPVPGGGIPNSNFTLSGFSGNNTEVDSGQSEIQRFDATSFNDLSLPDDTEQIYSIKVNTTPFSAEGEEEFTLTIGPTFNTTTAQPVGIVFTQQNNGVNIHQFRVELDTDLSVMGSNFATVRAYIDSVLQADTDFTQNGYTTAIDVANDANLFITHNDTETEYTSIVININTKVTDEALYGDVAYSDSDTTNSNGEFAIFIPQENIGDQAFAELNGMSLPGGYEFQLGTLGGDTEFYDEIPYNSNNVMYDDLTLTYNTIESPFTVQNSGIHYFRILDENDQPVSDSEAGVNVYNPIASGAADISIFNRPGGGDVVDGGVTPSILVDLGNYEYVASSDTFEIPSDRGAPELNISLHGAYDTDTNARVARVIRDAFNTAGVELGWLAALDDTDSEKVIITAQRSGYQYIVWNPSNITGFTINEEQRGIFDYSYTDTEDQNLAPIWPSYLIADPESGMNTTFILRDTETDISTLTGDEVAMTIRDMAVNLVPLAWGPSTSLSPGTDQRDIVTIDIDADTQDMRAARVIDGLWQATNTKKGNIHGFDTDGADLLVTEIQPGIYPLFTVPTYIGMIVTTGEDQYEWILYQVGELNDADQQSAVQILSNLFSRLRVANPRLSVVVTSNTMRIQPANYNEAANFVLEVYLNTTAAGAADIQRIEEAVAAGEMVTLSDGQMVIVSANQFNDSLYFKPGDTDLAVNAVGDGSGGTEAANLTVDSLAIDRVFDTIRPWPIDEINPNLEFPILTANQILSTEVAGESTTRTSNKILAADLGWTVPLFSADTDSDNLAQSYTSYFERLQFPISPEFTTEQLHAIALWADGSTSVEFLQPEEYNKLQVRISTTDNPGQKLDLATTAMSTNTFPVSEEYKVDIRANGRFYNMRVTDNLNDTDFEEAEINGKKFNRNTLWRVSGAQLEIMPSGRR